MALTDSAASNSNHATPRNDPSRILCGNARTSSPAKARPVNRVSGGKKCS